MDGFFRKIELNQRYISAMSPILNKDALFSDTTENYVIPDTPAAYERVRIRIRTGQNNVDRVYLCSQNSRHLMGCVESKNRFDYYETEIQLEDEKFTYYFELETGKIKRYYDMRGMVTEPAAEFSFVIIPGIRVPVWSKGAVMYQIYVDRFYNGDTSNDVLTDEYSYIGEHTHRVEDWYRYPAPMDVREFYGGDLQGVLDKMDYLESLGIEVIYFNPLFVSPSNHKYDIQDYDNIDPHFGKIIKDEGELLPQGCQENEKAGRYISRVTSKENLDASNALFAKVVEEAHKRGIRVILDGVFNHCGSFNKWLDHEKIYQQAGTYESGAYLSMDSPYHDYFAWHNQDPKLWPENDTYDGWWGHNTLPKLNYEASRSLKEYILHIGKKWVSPPYNADGWRLDVAADLGHSPEFNHQFWKEFRDAVAQANPSAVVLAEHYGSGKEWMQRKEWDTVMNYDAFMEPVSWFLTGMQKHSDDFRNDMLGNAHNFFDTMKYRGMEFPMPSLLAAMNELSNHDHSRFLTRTNHKVGRANSLGAHAAEEGVNKAVMREAVTMQMTWPGAPTIYYGDEAGLCGFTDPDNRRTYPWGREDLEMIAFHRQIIQIHKKYACFKRGSTIELYMNYNLIAYGRFCDANQAAIVVNNNDHEVSLDVWVWRMGMPKETSMKRVLFTAEHGFSTDHVDYEVSSGKVHVTLPKTSALILVREEREGKSIDDTIEQ